MKLLAVQPYIKVQRKITTIKQIKENDQREIRLYDDRVLTKYHEFLIEDVFDMSYRNIGEYGGLLYLHTVKGVYSYQVTSTPQDFIDTFKKTFKKKR